MKKMIPNYFRRRITLIAICILNCSSYFLFAKNEKDSVIVLNKKDLKEADDNTDLNLHFSKKWKYKIGDDTTWAAFGFNDNDWKEIAVKEEEIDISEDSLLKQIRGIIWFRCAFYPDSTQINKALAFYLKQIGSAAEVYMDGKFLAHFGKVGKDLESEEAQFSINPKPQAIVFSDTGKHIIAVRFSSFHYDNEDDSSCGFEISFEDLNDELDDLADPTTYSVIVFLLTVFLTLGVVHTILFFYFRNDRSNLFFGLYCIGISFVLFFAYYTVTKTDFEFFNYMLKAASLIAPIIIVPLVALYHTIYYQRLLRIFWIMLFLYAGSLVASYFEADFGDALVGILVLLSVIEILRVNIRAIHRKRDGAYILGLGILYLPLSIIAVIIFSIIYTGESNINVGPANIWGFSVVLAIPFSITLYLSRNYARINRKLIVQVEEIKNLSEKSLSQEAEKKKIVEEQNVKLEIKVAERTRELAIKNEVISVKNKEITDSLNYAKRIQAAILPDIKLIYKTLEQSFILYIPKDIVSGDFYAFAQKNDKAILAAADCTGHGVAGAFMSMIGSALLNQIINEKNITEPCLILEELNAGIIHSLKQKESESNDGMDISICSFDFKNNTVQFAGANRPLWLVRNQELIVYKPNKFPIGGLQVFRTEKFTQHEILLRKNDTLYLFSDGYADQFGGNNGKKMMTRNLKNVLLSIRDQSMKQQESFLRDYFEKWKSTNEQVDDVLMMGIRV